MPDEIERRRARSAVRWAALRTKPNAGLRAPTPGGEEHVAVERLREVRDAPRDVARDDQFEAGLATVIGRWRDPAA